MESQAQEQPNYMPFDQTIGDTVSRIAELHRNVSWATFQQAHRVPKPTIFNRPDGRQWTFLDIRPVDGDDGEPIVHFGASGDVIDPNYAMHIMPLALALPHTRIIAASNPSGLFERGNKLRLNEAAQLYRGNMQPLVAPALEYLHSEKISRAVAIGYSVGASTVWEAAKQADRYDIQISRVVSADPAAITSRGLFRVAAAFIDSEKQLGFYLGTCNSRALKEARRASGMWKYMARFFTVANMALAYSQGKATYETQAREALKQDPELTGHIIWGTDSKLAVNGVMKSITTRLKQEFGARVIATPLEGHAHAMCDDIDLYSALMLHGIA